MEVNVLSRAKRKQRSGRRSNRPMKASYETYSPRGWSTPNSVNFGVRQLGGPRNPKGGRTTSGGEAVQNLDNGIFGGALPVGR